MILGVLEHFSRQILSFFLSKFSPRHIQKPLIPLFSQQSRGSVITCCIVFLSISLFYLASQHDLLFSQHVYLLFSMFYYFDDVVLAFLGQDMPKYYACAQIHMHRCFLPCPCLDLHVYMLFAMFRSRPLSLCAPYHVHVSRSTCWLLCHVLPQPFCLLIYLFLAFWPIRQGVDLDLVVQAYIYTPRPTSKDLDNFLYACMLVCFPLYIHVCQLKSRFFHAQHPPWAYACQYLGPFACVVASVPFVVGLDVIACETHLCDVGALDTHLSPLCLMMLCFPFLLCATRLAFFASLHFCTLAYMFMHESLLACVIKPNSYYLV